MININLPNFPTYDAGQVKDYFDHIKLPASHQHTRESIQSQDSNTQVNFLNTLLRHQLCTVPFENLDLHYNPVKGVSFESAFLFNKVVTRRSGRGGYCMQNNCFLATILRSLGFHVTTLGARVSNSILGGPQSSDNDEAEYAGFGHQVDMITLPDGTKYFCDVGFGAAGPTHLIPLKDGYTSMNTGTLDQPATTMKLFRGWTANNTTRTEETKQWIYCIKFGSPDDNSKPFIQQYCFGEIEFFPGDYERLSYHISTTRSSFFVQNVLVQKSIMSDDGESIIGDYTLFNHSISGRKSGESKVLVEFKTEAERVEAFEKYFGINLSEAEREGIRGLPTEIREGPPWI